VSSLFLKYWKSVLSINLVFCLLVFRFEYYYLYSENSLLENLQGLLLFVGAVAYLALSRFVGSDMRLASVGAGLLCFSFFIREVDLELLPLLEHIGFMFHGPGRTLMLLLIWGFYIRVVVRQGPFMTLIDSLRSSQYFHYFVVAFLLLVVGAIFDKEFFPIQHGRLFEEVSETNAYLFLIMPALYELYTRFRERAEQAPNLAVDAKDRTH
jgi:hypothetical protein